MLTANKLAKKTNTSVHTIRHYTSIGLLNPETGSQNGYKIYNQTDKERLHFINAAKDLGYTLSEIADIFAEADKGNSSCAIL